MLFIPFRELTPTCQCVPDDGGVLVGAKEDADGVRVLGTTHPLIHQRDVEAELTGVFGLELASLEFNDDVSELLGVEEEQIDVEIVPVNIEANLATNEGEAGADLAESVDDAVNEALLEDTL